MQVLSGGHGARTYQDERFSYVVMRRGPRPGPETVPDLTVARQRQVDVPDAVQRAIEAGELHPLHMYRNRVLSGVVYSQHLVGSEPTRSFPSSMSWEHRCIGCQGVEPTGIS